MLCWPAPTSLLFPSHGDHHCDDPRPGATFGRPAESNTRACFEPNDLIEMNNTEVTPIFFHRPSVTSTYASFESIVTPSPGSDVDDEQKKVESRISIQQRRCSLSTSSR